ncbi:hypothetical protein COCNU_06G001770 [Cocos nucifera]|uniref:Uncharacterized protein n=1 Tax=Cocos nucifera TaxID=13894 RepID=A0A8K0I9N7_COCNU|nr:hypothetical protein COCNU_06G001770 [Cocos nucifera]
MASSSSSKSSSTAASTPPPPPPPSAAKKGFFRRILPLFLAANLGVGVYVLTRTSMKQPADKDEQVPSQVVSPGAPVPEKKSSAEPLPTPIKMLPPIPEHEQRQLFKWILEEKRKVKPSDPAEKKKIDEEKALLKQFIRSKSIPSL